jgi:mannose/cellobiose epimerase-like protein (N-acyl-D-glucosamine 2-epimerase family)
VTGERGASPEEKIRTGRVSSRAVLTPELAEVRDRYRTDLFEQYFPFWDRFGVDHDRGGVFCWLDYGGRRVSDAKYGWYQGRGLWVYSHAYRCFGRDPRFLEIAEKTYRFMLRHGRDEKGYWRRSIGPNGEPTEPADGMGYAGLFAAEGMQEFAHATGDTEALENAREAYHKSRSLFDDPTRHTRPDYLPVHYPGIRLLGMEMVILRFANQVLAFQDDPALKRDLEQAVARVLGPFLHPEHDLTSEALDHEYQRPEDANNDFFLLGHAMETMWMIMDAAPRLDDPSIEQVAADRFLTHSEVSWDRERGGFRTAVSLSNGPMPGRLLWHHDEALIGNLMLYALTGCPDNLDAFLRIDGYTTKTFRVNGPAGPVWSLEADDDGNPPDQVSRMGNYHVPRRQMLCLEWIDAIALNQQTRETTAS